MPLLKSYRQLSEQEWPLPPGESCHEEAEPVRQWLLSELVRTYRYPKEWLGKRIQVVDPDADSSGEPATLSARVLTSRGDPFLWLTVASTSQLTRAENKLRDTLLRDRLAAAGIASDGVETRFLRRRFDAAKCEYVVDLEPYAFTRGNLTTPQHALFDGSADPSRTRPLTMLTERVEDLFFEAHSHIRDTDGLHADEALDELCKVLFMKLYDEGTSERPATSIVNSALYGCTEEFATELRRLYIDAGERDRQQMVGGGQPAIGGVFQSPFRLSSPALVRVAETLQEYTISGSPSDIKGRAFQRVLVPAIRAGMGQYFTPENVIRFMVQAIEPTQSETLIDPFCGSAHFLSASLAWVRERANREEEAHRYAANNLHGIEKSDRMVRVARTDMKLHGDGNANVRCTDALLDFFNYVDLRAEMFDVILTNPPFGSLLRADAIAQLGTFELAHNRKSVPLEMLGLERSLQLLKPGGRMGIVVPEGLLANQRARYVREWLGRRAKIRGIVSLPVETFAPFGANIKTSILFLRKREKGEREEPYSVFLGRADNVGYDATGRSRSDGDLDLVREDFRSFISEQGW